MIGEIGVGGDSVKVIVKEPQQYRESYRRVLFTDVESVKEHGQYTTITFTDGKKSKRLTRLIVSTEG